MTCRLCGATSRAEAAWCSQCLAPVVEPPGLSRLETAPRRSPSPTRTPTYSRWRGGPTSFGPWGRVGFTLGYGLLVTWMIFANPIGLILLLVLGPWVLRDVWKKARVD